LVAADLHVALHLRARLAEPSEKTLQRWRLAALIFERQIEELIERIVGLGAEAGEKAASGAAGAKNLRIKIEWRLTPGQFGKLIEARRRPSEQRRLAGSASERGTQRQRPAIPGERKQIVVAETEQRTPQYRGKRKIVVG